MGGLIGTRLLLVASIIVGVTIATLPTATAAFGDSSLGWSGPQSVNPLGYLDSISCPTDTFCAAVATDFNGNESALTYDGTNWSTAVVIDGTNDPIAVSCASATFCMAVDAEGYAINYNGNSWSAPTLIAANTDLQGGVSCPTASFCEAVGWPTRCGSQPIGALTGASNAFTYNGTSWSAATTLNTNDLVDSVSCPTSTFCLAMGNNWYTYDGTNWSGPNATPFTAGGGGGASCATETFCAAIGNRERGHLRRLRLVRPH